MEVILEDNLVISSTVTSTRGLISQSNLKNQKKLSFTPTQATKFYQNLASDIDESTIISFDSVVHSNKSLFPKTLSLKHPQSGSQSGTSVCSSHIFEEEYPVILESLRKYSKSNMVKISEKKKSRPYSNKNIRRVGKAMLNKTKEDNPLPNKTEDFEKMTNIQEINNFKQYTNDCLEIIPRLTIPDPITLKNRYVSMPFANDIGLNKKRLAIFDLDETLIHCELKDIESAQKVIEVVITSSMRKTIGLNIRPLLKEELTKLKEKYYLIIYTASQQRYADAVLDHVDPNNELFSYRLYRNNCTLIKVDGQSLYVKDLRIFNNISMKDMVIIDNSILSFAFHLNNGIPILPYYRGNEETELKDLRILLENLANKHDFQTELKTLMNLEESANKCKQEEYEDLDANEDN